MNRHTLELMRREARRKTPSAAIVPVMSPEQCNSHVCHMLATEISMAQCETLVMLVETCIPDDHDTAMRLHTRLEKAGFDALQREDGTVR